MKVNQVITCREAEQTRWAPIMFGTVPYSCDVPPAVWSGEYTYLRALPTFCCGHHLSRMFRAAAIPGGFLDFLHKPHVTTIIYPQSEFPLADPNADVIIATGGSRCWQYLWRDSCWEECELNNTWMRKFRQVHGNPELFHVLDAAAHFASLSTYRFDAINCESQLTPPSLRMLINHSLYR